MSSRSFLSSFVDSPLFEDKVDLQFVWSKIESMRRAYQDLMVAKIHMNSYDDAKDEIGRKMQAAVKSMQATVSGEDSAPTRSFTDWASAPHVEELRVTENPLVSSTKNSLEKIEQELAKATRHIEKISAMKYPPSLDELALDVE